MADFEKYTVAFIFDPSMSKVLLVHKEKPEWQLGKLNGVGGKYEEGEIGVQCIAAKCHPESSLAHSNGYRKAHVYRYVPTVCSGVLGVFPTKYRASMRGFCLVSVIPITSFSSFGVLPYLQASPSSRQDA